MLLTKERLRLYLCGLLFLQLVACAKLFPVARMGYVAFAPEGDRCWAYSTVFGTFIANTYHGDAEARRKTFGPEQDSGNFRPTPLNAIRMLYQKSESGTQVLRDLSLEI